MAISSKPTSGQRRSSTRPKFRLARQNEAAGAADAAAWVRSTAVVLSPG